jgi:ADP-ribose pyrophosphatase YjhB (NUDIX family)
MKQIIINDNNIYEEEIERYVVRVKGLLINSEGKILLAHNNNTYQFPGGHKEDDETVDECIVREIKDETGIDVRIDEDAFLNIVTYDDNYFGTGKKVCNSIYYYRFFTDQKPNFNETHYDELELESDFNLFYVNFSDLGNFLKKSISNGSIDSNIGREMLYVYDEYNKVFGGIK